MNSSKIFQNNVDEIHEVTNYSYISYIDFSLYLLVYLFLAMLRSINLVITPINKTAYDNILHIQNLINDIKRDNFDKGRGYLQIPYLQIKRYLQIPYLQIKRYLQIPYL